MIDSHRIAPTAVLIARVVVGTVFLIAAVDKIGAPGAFLDAVRSYHVLPSSLVLPFAFALPWLELLVAVYLLLGFMTRVGAAGAIALLTMFILIMVRALVTGDTNHACGCFGAAANPFLVFLTGGDTITLWDVIRDLILVGLSGVVLVWGPGWLSIDHLIARRRNADGVLEAA